MSYVELLGALELSPLVKKGTVLVVEYPKAEAQNMKEEIGRLTKARRAPPGPHTPAHARARSRPPASGRGGAEA